MHIHTQDTEIVFTYMYLITNAGISMLLQQQPKHYQTAIFAGLKKCSAAILHINVVLPSNMRSSTNKNNFDITIASRVYMYVYLGTLVDMCMCFSQGTNYINVAFLRCQMKCCPAILYRYIWNVQQ